MDLFGISTFLMFRDRHLSENVLIPLGLMLPLTVSPYFALQDLIFLISYVFLISILQ